MKLWVWVVGGLGLGFTGMLGVVLLGLVLLRGGTSGLPLVSGGGDEAAVRAFMDDNTTGRTILSIKENHGQDPNVAPQPFPPNQSAYLVTYKVRDYNGVWVQCTDMVSLYKGKVDSWFNDEISKVYWFPENMAPMPPKPTPPATQPVVTPPTITPPVVTPVVMPVKKPKSR